MLADFVQELLGFRLKDTIAVLDDRVLNLIQKVTCQITGKFYVYMAILEGLAENDNYYFDHHNVILCFALKSMTNNFFSPTERSFINKFCNHRNKIHYEKF